MSMFGGTGGGTPQGGFSFGTATTSGSTGLLATPASSAAAAPTGFGFGGTGTPASGTGGFSFGASATSAGGAPATGFSFGGGGTSTSTTPSTATATPGFSFGATPGASTAGGCSSGFSLAPKTTATSGFAFSTPATTSAPSVGTGFAIGTPTASTGAGGFLAAGSSAAATTTAGTGLLSGLLATPASAPAGVQPVPQVGKVTQPSATSAAPLGGFKLGGAASTATTGFTLGGGLKTSLAGSSTVAVSTAATSAATTSAGGFGFGVAATTTTAAPGFGIGTATAATGGLGATAATSSAGSAATTAAVASSKMNYRQLEENINKWMLELEEQERVFLQQATHVNAWDRQLVDNGEKITSLNSDLERVKVDQGKLEQELEFITCQQKELEELLVPMETSLDQLPSSSLQPHADLERENTYQLSDNIDAQLKRMAQDLREIIDHLNMSNSTQDSNDPVLQITKILNAHMDSLQWIDTNTALLSRRVEDVSKQMENQRKDQERNFRLVYD